MHRGVHELIALVDRAGEDSAIKKNAPAPARELNHFEQSIGSPLPSDLRFVLSRFNGAVLPSGVMLGVSGDVVAATMPHVLRALAERLDRSFLDPDVLLPFQLNEDGSVLAFDRSAGPVAETWPIVDYFESTGEVRLVYRTFDGWCRFCVEQWSSPDFTEPFSLARYRRQGERHAAIEPDVASAHATVAHALKRSGEPEAALAAYLRASRCVPPIWWSDWEALKLAIVLRDEMSALLAAERLVVPAPSERWGARETSPLRVIGAVSLIAVGTERIGRWLRVVQLLRAQIDPEEREPLAYVDRVRAAIQGTGDAPPPLVIHRPLIDPATGASPTLEALREPFAQGLVRDEELLFDPAYTEMVTRGALTDLYRQRREF